jgi:hypothetical protein
MSLSTSATPLSANAPAPTVHERIGFEIGWDHAHHGLALPALYAGEASPLRDGLAAGRAAFGTRTLAPHRHVQRWLRLRLSAWLRGRSVETFQVTPHYLRQINAAHCPITRTALGGDGADAVSIDRVRDDAGYAAGNLAVMSRRANHAKAHHGFAAAWHYAEAADDRAARLSPEEWGRVAVLCSFVEALPHRDACALPLLVLPPNRLRLFNPAQALQAMLSRQLLQAGWSRRISRFEELLPGGAAVRRDFKRFFFALLPRVLEAGRLGDSAATAWAIEDAWRSPRVLQHWMAFAEPLGAAGCERLLAKAAAHGLTTTGVEAMAPEQATDGWDLETRGYVAPAAAPQAPSAQAQLAF